MVAVKGTQRPEDFAQWGRIAREVAKAGLPMHSHTTLENTADGFLDQIEQINKEFPVRNLRWTLIHDEQVNASHLERMRNLGVSCRRAASRHDHGRDLQPRARRPLVRHAALKTIQDSGVIWGLGTDAFEVNQYRPFTTLWFAVTGKMVGGTVVNRQPISREDALIAHTRRNAFTDPAGEQPGFDPAGQARGSGRARSRLPHHSGGSDQGHQAGDDDGRRPSRLRSADLVNAR